MVRWRITNNIVDGSGRGSGVDIGTGLVEIASSEHNLVFGHDDNGIHPPPISTAGDDTSGNANETTVFVAQGDYRPEPNGPAVGTAINVYGDPAYGTVRTDILGRQRPMSGSWDRGAYRVGP
jgi:hypothetical protein